MYKVFGVQWCDVIWSQFTDNFPTNKFSSYLWGEQIHFKIAKPSNDIIYNAQLTSFNFKMNCAHIEVSAISILNDHKHTMD